MVYFPFFTVARLEIRREKLEPKPNEPRSQSAAGVSIRKLPAVLLDGLDFVLVTIENKRNLEAPL